MSDNSKLKPPPRLNVDEEAERFVDEVDLTENDLTGFTSVRFEFDKKSAHVNMRLPESLLRAVKAKAQQRGIPYQRFIREAIEQALVKR